MTRLDREPEILRLAHELKADLRNGPVAGIVHVCHRKLRSWIRELGREPATIAELEQLVCQKLRLVFEEIFSDSDLEQVIRKYVAAGEHVFAMLKADLDAKTFATLIERHCATAASPDRYVAVIDCRGEKLYRRFFTRWHEIAHLLTLTRQLDLPFHRSTTNKSPLERLMDVVAGEVGFHSEIIDPEMTEELKRVGYLSFAGVERIRIAVCSDASFTSTLNTCVKRWPKDVALIEAGMGYKKAEHDAMNSPQLSFIPKDVPEAQLRVLSVQFSDVARATRFRIDRNMAVPAESIVYQAFFGISGLHIKLSSAPDSEDLEIWRHSNGESVGRGRMLVEVRQSGDRLLALVQPDRRKPH